MTTQALFLNGAVGVGKTATLEAVGELLAERQVPGALIDLDWLRKAWPTTSDDPFHLDLELANLTAVAANFRAAGARVVAVAGVLERPAARDSYLRALGCPLVVIRLRAPRELVQSRLAARHVGNGAELEWHLARFEKLTRILDDAGLDDAVIEAGEQGPREVAQRVLEAFAD